MHWAMGSCNTGALSVHCGLSLMCPARQPTSVGSNSKVSYRLTLSHLSAIPVRLFGNCVSRSLSLRLNSEGREWGLTGYLSQRSSPLLETVWIQQVFAERWPTDDWVEAPHSSPRPPPSQRKEVKRSWIHRTPPLASPRQQTELPLLAGHPSRPPGSGCSQSCCTDTGNDSKFVPTALSEGTDFSLLKLLLELAN